MDDTKFDLLTLLRELEERLHAPSVRASAAEVAALLADDFVEIGRSGTVYGKAEVVAALPLEKPETAGRLIAGEDYAVRLLAPGVALLTYRTLRMLPDGSAVASLRSSIWQKSGDRWRMVFHQGTPTPAD